MSAPLISALPTLNAGLNATSALLLVAGYLFIRQRRVLARKTCMVSALVVSTAFLISYLTYHYQVGSVRFGGQWWVRLLAVLILPLALVTVYRALRARFDRP